MNGNKEKELIIRQFIQELRHHLSGIKRKVRNEFSEKHYYYELEQLKSDTVYTIFHFDCPEYVLIRFMGRISISVGRRLGEIYDKIPRLLACAKFGLSSQQVAPKIGGLELDVGLDFDFISESGQEHIQAIAKKYLGDIQVEGGIGIEARYNFNPNDSARLRKDVSMANGLAERSLLPVYLIFSSISPREDAIARLQRAGWRFLIGDAALNFTRDLYGLDMIEILERPEIKSEIHDEVTSIMDLIFGSFAFNAVMEQRQ